MVDCEERGEWKQTILPEVEDVVLAGLTEDHIFVANLSVLVELGETFVEPEWDPGGFAHHVVRVLVVDGAEGVLALGIEPQEDVVLVGAVNEESGKIELVFGEIGGGLEGLKSLFVFEGNDDDGCAGVIGRMGHD